MYIEEEILPPFLYTTHLYFLVICTYSMFTLSYEKILQIYCQFRRGNLWSEQPSVPPAEDVITGLEFLVDLPMLSLVGQQNERKNKPTVVDSSRTITKVKQH